MKTVYLILAHTAPEQVGILTATLATDPSARIYVHIDARADERAFVSAIDVDVAFVRPRFASRRAGFGLVRATLAGLRAIQREVEPPFYVLLLSGQDFPVKPLRTIHDFYRACDAAALIDHVRLGPAGWNVADRVTRYWFHDVMRLGPLNRALSRLASRILPKRRIPLGFEPYGGSQWWSLRHDAVAHVLAFIDEHPSFERFFRFTSVPDEVFFHTVLLNSGLAPSVDPDPRRFQEFPHGAGSPRTLTEHDIGRLLASTAHFARKWGDVDIVRALSARLAEVDPQG